MQGLRHLNRLQPKRAVAASKPGDQKNSALREESGEEGHNNDDMLIRRGLTYKGLGLTGSRFRACGFSGFLV